MKLRLFLGNPIWNGRKIRFALFNEQFYQFLGEPETEEPEPLPEEPEPSEDDPKIPLQNEEEGGGEVNDEEQEPISDLPPDKMVLTPEEDDRWGLIGDYSENLEYDYSEGVFDYVVAEGTVFYPVFNPNPDELVDGVNITRDDPRNANIVAHLSRIAFIIFIPSFRPPISQKHGVGLMRTQYSGFTMLPNLRSTLSCREKGSMIHALPKWTGH